MSLRSIFIIPVIYDVFKGYWKDVGEVKSLWESNMDLLKEDDEFIALANPKVIKKSKSAEEDLEGCMSVPQKYGFVMRSKKVKISAQNIKGENIYLDTDGLMARILQHEIDHLNGILFTDHITDDNKIYTLSKDGTLINKQMKTL